MERINITTIVGCPVKCSYCPQDVFLKNYTSDVKLLTLDSFKLILNNINKNVLLNFAGFAENFYNPYLIDMMAYSNEMGYEIGLYTTMRGFTLKKLNEMKKNNIRFSFVYFHEYDGIGFDKNVFDDMVLSFLREIKPDDYIIETINTPSSRASNNKNYNIEYRKNPLFCNFHRQSLLYFENTLVPNGDVYICCMDFALKHKIGNLLEHGYDSVEFNNERKLIQDLQLSEDSDLLCRKCEYSYNI
jgi:radical SAM protein with 4Fe4S-binding SPASM domain